MSAKRKDNKGRVLRTGESQRKDLTYQYRYQDITGKRRTVYAPTLEELRIKEDVINNAQEAGTDYNAGNITVLELLERYISLKQGVRLLQFLLQIRKIICHEEPRKTTIPPSVENAKSDCGSRQIVVFLGGTQ